MSKENKIGRNDKCPCGSGKKFKKCHLLNMKNGFSEEKDAQSFQQMAAKEYQRKEQQGLGREIISIDHQGQKFVAVGSHLLSSKSWKTFYDFLGDYIKRTLGVNWGTAELKKDLKDRHPILQWYQYWGEFQLNNKVPPVGGVSVVPHIGASTAYFGLAYNLYLLEHNKGIQAELIRRVKQEDMGNFYGAIYETYVAAHFIKAGFDLEFENESDRSTSHCEFTATHKVTGRKFSVEAKALEPKKEGKSNVIPRLNNALRKQAKHERIVFIDVGRPATNFEESKKWLKEAQQKSRKLETDPNLHGEELPPAYIVFTNNSYWHDLQGQNFKFAALGEGFKIPSFKDDYKDTIQNALLEREKNKEVFDLLDSMHTHQEIPVTFDGENPELAFTSTEDEDPRLIIGNKYLIPSANGDVVATLKQVIVREEEKVACGLYELQSGGSSLVNHPLSDIELAAYKRHPRTFFGVVEPKKEIESPLEFYDWLYNASRNTPKENLLKFMKDYPNQEGFKNLTQEELLKIYCEGATGAATMNNPKVTE